jgi:hypothetical protein
VMLLHHLQRDAMPEVVRLEDRVAPDHRDTDLACWCSITRRYRSSNPGARRPKRLAARSLRCDGPQTIRTLSDRRSRTRLISAVAARKRLRREVPLRHPLAGCHYSPMIR